MQIRDESGAESFRFFREKTETEGKYENGNGIRQNGNKYGIFFGGNGNGNGTTFSGGTEAETEIPFPPNTEFPFYCLVA